MCLLTLIPLFKIWEQYLLVLFSVSPFTRDLIDKILSTLLYHALASNYNWNCAVFTFHTFVTSFFKMFIFRKLLELFEINIIICWNCNIYYDTCILFKKIFMEMSGRFASIFLSVLIVNFHRIVTSVLSITGCGVCSCYFFYGAR